MLFWIIVYDHRHGTDVWPRKWAEGDTAQSVRARAIEELTDDGEYEADRDDEHVDVRGPFDLE